MVCTTWHWQIGQKTISCLKNHQSPVVNMTVLFYSIIYESFFDVFHRPLLGAWMCFVWCWVQNYCHRLDVVPADAQYEGLAFHAAPSTAGWWPPALWLAQAWWPNIWQSRNSGRRYGRKSLCPIYVIAQQKVNHPLLVFLQYSCTWGKPSGSALSDRH